MAEKTAGPARKRILHRITSNYGWALVSDVGGKGFLFLVTIYLARNLGVEQYGFLSFAQSIAAYFWLGVDLGINMYGSREISKDKQNAADIINPLLTLRMISGLVVFAFYICVSLFLSKNPVQQMVFIGCAFYLATRSLNIDWVFRGFEKFEYIAIGNFATFSSMLLLMWLLVKDGSDVVMASYLWSFSYLVGGILMLRQMRTGVNTRFRPVFDLAIWKNQLKRSLEFTSSGLLLNLYLYMPILLLGLFATEYEVGLFSAPFKAVIAVTFFAGVLPLALYPIFAELHHTNVAKFKKMLSWLLAVSIAMGVAIGAVGSLFSREIMMSLYGEKYIDGIGILNVIIWYAALIPVRLVYRTVIATAGLELYYSVVAGTSVVVFASLFFGIWRILGLDIVTATCYALVLAEVVVLSVAAAIWQFKGARTLAASA